MHSANAYKVLMKEFFGDEGEEYNLIPAYADEARGHGHKIIMEVDNGVFNRLAIVYKEEITSFSQYDSRGLCVDGTFMKTTIGGTLLVACFQNGNKQIQIVGVAIVSGENEVSWRYFLKFLLESLPVTPKFIMSDRDKGVIPALARLHPEIHHFYCFRHVMENFNKNFKSQVLKNLAWGLAKSTSERAFNKFSNDMRKLNDRALQWLLDIGKDKWSLCYSPCPRYGMVMPNNVESVNSALKGIRKLPVIDLLLKLERYISKKWVDSSAKFAKWSGLTEAAYKYVQDAFSGATESKIVKCSIGSYIVRVIRRVGYVPLEYTARISGSKATCSCGFDQDIQAPCEHALHCLRYDNRLSELENFFDVIWKTSSFAAAYSSESEDFVSQPTIKSLLIPEECRAPTIKKKRG